EKIAEELKDAGIRVEGDVRSERLQAKIRDATLQKVPFMGIIGDKELASEDKLISVRARNGENLGQLSLTNFIQKVLEHIDTKV
ncbi:MAG: His/Gly/Thr/Pro-type tRNA ligase C-terminal domain-containing protein, partial [Patescibacteria group bacterium]